jgi:hypothetical protein
MAHRARSTLGHRSPSDSANPEVVAYVVAVRRQMEHAANLVVAFFRSVGMMEASDTALPELPSQFLLELAALLQVREWHAAGVIGWFDPEGLSVDDMISQAIERLKDDPAAIATDHRGTEAMTDVLRIWTETCAPDARGHLDADVAIRWDSSVDLDPLIGAFSDFLCRHRNAGVAPEAT